MSDQAALAASVVLLVQKALSPVLERLAAAEARLAVLGDVRDRIVTVETKAAMPLPEVPRVDLAPVLDRLASVEARPFATKELWDAMTETIVTLRERVAVLEVRPLMPGPPGEPGAPGKDGKDGEPGTAGLSYVGVYQEGKSYDVGQAATYGGSMWHCNEPTETKPGEGSKAWTLIVKRGQNGRDGRDAVSLPVVSVGRS